MTTFRFTWMFLLATLLIVITTYGQDQTQPNTAPPASLTITANAVSDRVRVTAPSSVVQMRLEVYAATGIKLFDEELRGANVFDWHLQDGQAQRLPAGDYVCVVTAKTISGKITQKVGAVTIAENSASVRAGDSQQFTSPQAQAIGPVEADSSWTIVADGENKTTTVIANTGTEGQMIRGRGALTFRIGDFFRGKDEEQMRLSEEGNLGIGTSTPQSKLDVAGTVRAERFVVVRPSTPGSKAQGSGATQTADSDGSVQPLASGTGTQNQIAKWLETGGSGTLGNSGITETAGGNVGIGTTSPGDKLTVNGNLGVGSNRIYNGVTNNSAGIDFITPGLVNVSGFSGIAFNSSTATIGSQTERMRISNNGNVGIGTSNPSDTLSVNGNIGVGPNKIYNGAGNNSAGIDFITPGFLNLSGFSGITFNSSAATLGSQTERLRITNNGNVGIGTTNPASTLDVAGDINTSTQYNIGGAAILSIAGNANLFAGTTAGRNNTSGLFNSFFGQSAGFSNTTGSDNSFFGTNAGLSSTTGNDNAFFGAEAGHHNTTGSSNAFFGQDAGFSTTTGSSNAFFGQDAGFSTTTGGSNAFFGTEAGTHNTIGFDNAFFGKDAGFQNTNGLFNSFFGASAGQNNTTGNSNVFLGRSAGLSITTENNNTLLGTSADGAAGISNATAIGANAQVTQSNSLVLGSINGVNNATADTNVGIGTSAPTAKLDVNGAINVQDSNSKTFFGGVSTELSAQLINFGMNDSRFGASNTSAQGGFLRLDTRGSRNLFQFLGRAAGNTGSVVELMDISAAGDVGIGTTAPAKHLHVFGPSDQEIAIESSDTNGRQWTLQSSRGATDGRLEIIDRTANANRFTILSNGNVGIGGVTGPGVKLQIGNGDVAITTQGNGLILHATNGGNCFRLTVNDNGDLSTTHVNCP